MNKTCTGTRILQRAFIPFFTWALVCACPQAQSEEELLPPQPQEVEVVDRPEMSPVPLTPEQSLPPRLLELSEVLPRNIFASETAIALTDELDRDFGRLKFGAMKAWYFSTEYTNPLREYDSLDPQELYPDDYDEFENWLQDNLLEAIMEALEHHPAFIRAVNGFVSVFNPGIATHDLDEKEHEFTSLEEASRLQVLESKRTMKITEVNGATEKFFGEDYQMLSRFVWLDISDGFQDVVRWETRLLDVQFFGKQYLSLDEIRTDLTVNGASVKLIKAHPFGLPFLATAFAKYEDGEGKWGLIFTLEKRDMVRAARLYEDRRRGKKVRIPLKRKLDFGVIGEEGGAWRVGFVYRGMI